MTKQVKPAPKHRAPVERSALVAAPRKALRNTVILSSVAVAVTGATVSTGVLGQGSAISPVGSVDAAASNARADDASPASSLQVDDLAERDTSVSRSSRRQALNSVKKASVVQTKVSAMSRTEDMSDEDPRSIGQALLAEFGFSQDQFGCLDSLWTRESNWTWNADNPTSSAYGIPQALPGSKMSSAGADWATNPVTQIRWGLGYIQDRYGSPCGAWAHSESHNWY
ncbi:lytic transglycosylase domain-containing protein [Nocardioides sp. cx-173]|uniref:aggregation-promoting factor C-terminal-like domain-containing protein n=1 Tax=Nocardioides sp. cx-173 TaxID=2898796 RepID=UPI001E3992A7|nr:lytic transglycosylase domain-containing protein [Nocardioides sp. cx-173]MCD4525528.1 lytic transglycosylase domain-containing protein [Nocardioides sp. cx-173]UGB42672.1 lytic transglycosylase domain-containing protein [Nocardioides sp. cx-173]